MEFVETSLFTRIARQWSAGGKGKRGGARVIYCWLVRDDQIFPLTIYGKSEVDGLTRAEVEALRRIVMEWKDV